ncbi:MAG: stage V sporulation protein S [Acidimicrobiales bacterium]|nr:stage V sporulation protein S [Acidimicrobiales bacterium]
MHLLRVSSRSDPNAVAGALAGVVRRSGQVAVQVVGAGALNQAVKAVAIARKHVLADGIDLVCSPGFVEVDVDGEERTALRLVVHDRRHPHTDDGPAVDLRDDLLPRPGASGGSG